MSLSLWKLWVTGLLALACIIALIVNADENYVWAAPILGILVGYVVGNTRVTENQPIISTKS